MYLELKSCLLNLKQDRTSPLGVYESDQPPTVSWFVSAVLTLVQIIAVCFHIIGLIYQLEFH